MVETFNVLNVHEQFIYFIIIIIIIIIFYGLLTTQGHPLIDNLNDFTHRDATILFYIQPFLDHMLS